MANLLLCLFELKRDKYLTCFFYSLLTVKPSLPHKKCHVCAKRLLFTNSLILYGFLKHKLNVSSALIYMQINSQRCYISLIL
jgi:hypothetical protein